MAQQERPFLIAGRTTATLSAGKCNKKLGPAIRTPDSGESLLQVSALEKLVDGISHHRPPKSVVPLKPLRIDALKEGKIIAHQGEKRRCGMIPGTVYVGRLCRHAHPPPRSMHLLTLPELLLSPSDFEGNVAIANRKIKHSVGN